MTRITTLYATYAYTDLLQPTWVQLYRDPEAKHCVATIPVDSASAPKRTDRIINLARTKRRGVIETTSYALEWID